MGRHSEKAMAPHSSTLAWKIPWTAWKAAVHGGRWGSATTERLHFHFSLSCIGEGNGNPLQCSWLENPRDGGAWWAAVYGVAQSRTRLKRLSSSSSSNAFELEFGGKIPDSVFYQMNKKIFLVKVWPTCCTGHTYTKLFIVYLVL